MNCLALTFVFALLVVAMVAQPAAAAESAGNNQPSSSLRGNTAVLSTEKQEKEQDLEQEDYYAFVETRDLLLSDPEYVRRLAGCGCGGTGAAGTAIGYILVPEDLTTGVPAHVGCGCCYLDCEEATPPSNTPEIFPIPNFDLTAPPFESFLPEPTAPPSRPHNRNLVDSSESSASFEFEEEKDLVVIYDTVRKGFHVVHHKGEIYARYFSP